MIRWCALVSLNIVFTVFAMLTCWIWPFFAEVRWGWTNNANDRGFEPRLPTWLSWFDTPDNSLYGDAGHRERWAGYAPYWQMAAWLFRNPAYGFGIDVCGARINKSMIVSVEGDPSIRNRDQAREGKYWCEVGGFWNYKSITDIGGGRCFMVELGWKLQDYAKDPRYRSDAPAQIVCSFRFTPFNP